MTKSWAAWRGRGTGATVGLLVAGAAGLGAAPEYLDDPAVGVPVAAAGGVLGFVVGQWWDRRAARQQAEQERRQQWSQFFSDEPLAAGAVDDADPVVQCLDPSARVVPFERGHSHVVRRITQWCGERQPGRVWLVAGGPGAGKTRVAMRALEQLRRRTGTAAWAGGWLLPGADVAQAVDVAAGWPQPVLIVVDDADLRDDLSALLAETHRPRHAGAQTVRLLLVAREFGLWWTAVQQPLRGSVDTAAAHGWVGPLAAEPGGQLAATRRAASAFAGLLAVDVAPSALQFRGVQAGTPAWLLHAAAVEAVLRAADGSTAPVDVHDAVAGLMDRQREMWWREAARQGLNRHRVIDETLLRDVLVLSALVGAADAQSADTLLRRLPALADADVDLIDRLLVWLHLYGITEGHHTRPHLPAVLAEHLVAEALAERPQLAAAVAASAVTDTAAGYVLAVLSRAASHTPSALAAAQTFLHADLDRFLPLAITQTRHGLGPLDEVLASSIDSAQLDFAAVSSLDGLLPGPAETLLHTAAALAHVRVSTAPSLVDRAQALRDYADRLTRAGRYDQAVAVSADAVSSWRQLAVEGPRIDRAYLAGALVTLADALSVVDRHEESTAAASEAVARWGEFLGDSWDSQRDYLAGALVAQADGLRRVGKEEEAVVAASEAVVIRRRLTADSDEHPDRLATALTALADALGATERHDEAIVAATEAVAIKREIAEVVPDPHRRYLAAALSTLAQLLRRAGRHDEAVAAAAEAVSLRRLLAETQPDAHRGHLAEVLTILAHALSSAHRAGEGVIAATEAVALRRALADAWPDIHGRSLALSLTALADASAKTKRFDMAVAAATEAVDIWPECTNALGTMAIALHATGRRNEAAAAAKRVIDLLSAEPNGERRHAANLTVARQIINAS